MPHLPRSHGATVLEAGDIFVGTLPRGLNPSPAALHPERRLKYGQDREKHRKMAENKVCLDPNRMENDGLLSKLNHITLYYTILY